MKHTQLRTLAFDALMLALLCAIAGLVIPVSSLKITLQILIVFILGLLNRHVYDSLLVTGCYCLMALFLPICAGYVTGLQNPTFGFVIGFIPAVAAMHGVRFLFHKADGGYQKIAVYALACLAAILVSYAVSVTYMFFYFRSIGNEQTLSYIVVSLNLPYILVDIAKTVLAVALVLPLEKPYRKLIARD